MHSKNAKQKNMKSLSRSEMNSGQLFIQTQRLKCAIKSKRSRAF